MRSLRIKCKMQAGMYVTYIVYISSPAKYRVATALRLKRTRETYNALLYLQRDFSHRIQWLLLYLSIVRREILLSGIILSRMLNVKPRNMPAVASL